MTEWSEFIKEHFNTKVPFFNFLGAEVTETGLGMAEVKLAMRPEFGNTYGLVHGGVLAALIDMAAGVALRTLKHKILTIETANHFFKPVSPTGEVTAKAGVVSVGRKILYAEVDLVDSEGALAAKGQATFYIIGEDTGIY